MHPTKSQELLYYALNYQQILEVMQALISTWHLGTNIANCSIRYSLFTASVLIGNVFTSAIFG